MIEIISQPLSIHYCFCAVNITFTCVYAFFIYLIDILSFLGYRDSFYIYTQLLYIIIIKL